MKLNIYNKFLALFIAASVLSACEEMDHTYQGESQVGFEEASYAMTIDVADFTDSLRFMLIGAPATEDITLQVMVSDTGTTATEGVHYTLQSTEVTIPAGSNFGSVYVDVLAGGFTEPGQEETLSLQIDASSLTIARNFSGASVDMQKNDLEEIFNGKFFMEQDYYADDTCTLENDIYDPYLLIGNRFWNDNTEIQYQLDTTTQEVSIVTESVELYEVLYPIEGSGTYNSGSGVINVAYLVYYPGTTVVFEEGNITLTKLANQE